MKKKEYKEPSIRVAKLKSCNLICTSGEGSSTENIRRGSWWGPGPDTDDDGIIWAD